MNSDLTQRQTDTEFEKKRHLKCAVGYKYQRCDHLHKSSQEVQPCGFTLTILTPS